MANDTTTTVGSSGGDLLDETLAQNVAGQNVKRPRVVIAGNDGTIPDAGEQLRLLNEILLQMRRQTFLLQALLADTTAQTFGDDKLDAMIQG